MSVRNALVLFLALSTMSLLVGCGSSGPKAVAPPTGGFTTSSLNGTYVFSFSGTDVFSSNLAASASYFSVVGALTASSGALTGTIDVIDPELGEALNISPVLTAQTLTGGSYSITPDGRGSGTIRISPNGTNIEFGLDFVLMTPSHGLITRFDPNGTGSGTIDLQDSTLTQSALTSYAFSLSGVDGTIVNPFVTAGAFTLGGTSTISTGLQDINDDNNSTTNLPLTGSLTLGAAGSAGAALLTATDSPYGTLSFDVWPIDATHMKLIEVDGAEYIEGDAFTQQATISSGQLVYTMAGLDAANDSVLSSGGFLTYTAPTTIANGYEDINDGGSIGSSLTVSGSLTATGGGRYQLVLGGLYNSAVGAGTYYFAAYPTANGGILLMEDDNAGVTAGTAFFQTAQTFASAQGYGLNLTGQNSDGEVDDIAEFTATSGTVQNCSSGGTLSEGIIDENDEGTTGFRLPLGPNGSYCFDSTGSGRGELLYPDTGTLIGTLTLDFYVANSSTVLFIDADSEAQTGVGTFQLQNASASSPALANTQSHASALKAAAVARARRRQK
ncbi:MAG: hypothetical protein WAM13_20650 [Candidatus Sulfotelmatobacter sp.]|jgi:hypothetical protein